MVVVTLVMECCRGGGGIYGCWCGDPPMLWGWGCRMGTCPSPRVSVSPFEGGVIRLNCAPPPLCLSYST